MRRYSYRPISTLHALATPYVPWSSPSSLASFSVVFPTPWTRTFVTRRATDRPLHYRPGRQYLTITFDGGSSGYSGASSSTHPYLDTSTIQTCGSLFLYNAVERYSRRAPSAGCARSLSMNSFDVSSSLPASFKLDIRPQFFLVSFLGFCTIFRFSAARFSACKQTSWIITTTASCIMTLVSLPYLWDYMAAGSVKGVRSAPVLSISASTLFQAYLSA